MINTYEVIYGIVVVPSQEQEVGNVDVDKLCSHLVQNSPIYI